MVSTLEIVMDLGGFDYSKTILAVLEMPPSFKRMNIE